MTDGFSELAMNLLRNKANAIRLDNPTHVGKAGDEGAGDYVVIEIEIKDNAIQNLGYRCNGCPTTIACCELLAVLAKGRNINVLKEISTQVMQKMLGQVAEGKEGIPAFVLSSLANALNDENRRTN